VGGLSSARVPEDSAEQSSKRVWGSGGAPKPEVLLAQRDPRTPLGQTSEEITRDVLARCDRLGFDAAGIAPAIDSMQADALQRWLDSGMHDELAYMTQSASVRRQPWRLLEGTNSFLMVALSYVKRGDASQHAHARDRAFDPQAGALGKDEGMGRIARYARMRDYHDVLKRRLHALADCLRKDYPGSEFRSFVDTAPVNERELAAAAGLGWQAKNAMLIHPKLGSYFVIGGFATTLALVPSMPRGSEPTDHCGSCTRCLDACPTQAIVSPRVVDARRCISNLTIERRTPIDPQLQPLMGDWIAGCDICQQVCPHNSPRVSPMDEAASQPSTPFQTRGTIPLHALLSWTESQRREAFATSALKRITLAMAQRNAAIAHANWSREKNR
jgi:epoxyqueuosine reductase